MNLAEHNFVRQKVIQTLDKLGNPEILKNLTVKWNKRFTNRLGDAKVIFYDGNGRSLKRAVVRLSIPLWERASLAERTETIVHEVCHVVADWRAGSRQKHGPAWQSLMRQCDYEEARRCHNVDNSDLRRKRTRIKFYCGCLEGHVLGPIRAKRIIRKTASYTCKRCGERLHQ